MYVNGRRRRPDSVQQMVEDADHADVQAVVTRMRQRHLAAAWTSWQSWARQHAHKRQGNAAAQEFRVQQASAHSNYLHDHRACHHTVSVAAASVQIVTGSITDRQFHDYKEQEQVITLQGLRLVCHEAGCARLTVLVLTDACMQCR